MPMVLEIGKRSMERHFHSASGYYSVGRTGYGVYLATKGTLRAYRRTPISCLQLSNNTRDYT